MKSFRAGEIFGKHIDSVIREYKHAEDDEICMSVGYAREELEELINEFDDDLEMFALISSFNNIIELWRDGVFKIQHKR